MNLVAAGGVSGVVRLADGETSAGAGVRVDLFNIIDTSEPLETTFTNDRRLRVPARTCRQLSARRVRHGCESRSIARDDYRSGQQLEVPIAFLGRGSVAGVVLDGSGQPVANVALRFTSSSVFGDAPVLTRSAAADGTFRFDGVLVGDFTVTARDSVTDQAGSVSGQVSLDLEIVHVQVHLSNWGGLTGIVYRADGATTVAGARVSTHGVSTTTDAEGRYTLTLLPLGPYVLTASDPGTRGLGQVTGALVTHAATELVDIRLFDQGSLLVTVVDSAATPVPNAVVTISASNGVVGDTIPAQTGADGTVLVQHVLAGGFTIQAIAKSSPARRAGPLAAGSGTAGHGGSRPHPQYCRSRLPAGRDQPCNHRIDSNWERRVPANSDGTYRVDGLKLGSYTVSAYDSGGRLRARVSNVSVATGGATVPLNLTFVALATVNGRVITPEGSSSSSAAVTVRSEHPWLSAGRSWRLRMPPASMKS